MDILQLGLTTYLQILQDKGKRIQETYVWHQHGRLLDENKTNRRCHILPIYLMKMKTMIMSMPCSVKFVWRGKWMQVGCSNYTGCAMSRWAGHQLYSQSILAFSLGLGGTLNIGSLPCSPRAKFKLCHTHTQNCFAGGMPADQYMRCSAGIK